VSAESGTRWGWHQLAEPYASRLVADAGIRRGDLVVEVGAGTGAVTAALVAAGAQVIAVELHGRRADVLRSRFDGSRVTVVRADAADLRLPRRPFRVVANPPFAITAALLHRLLAPGSRLLRADLVVPTHVAQRWAYERVRGAGRWRLQFDAWVGPRVPSHAFRPTGPPAAVLVISRR
jgi:23S rRNA (adenine-N6)-dimethyltransferase